MSSYLSDVTYVGGYTLGVDGIGDGKMGVSLDGTGRVNTFSSSFAADFPLTELTVSMWIKILSAQWADATLRYLCGFRADVNNRMSIEKSVTANTLLFRYLAGATNKVVTASSVTSQDWLNVVMTVSKSQDRLRAYINASKIGADITGLGTWAGALVSPYAAIGSDRNSAGSHIGGIARFLIINRESTETEVSYLANPFDSSPIGILPIGDSKTASASPGIQGICDALKASTGRLWSEMPYRIGVSGMDTATFRGRIDSDFQSINQASLLRVKTVIYNLGANDNNSAPSYEDFYDDTNYCLSSIHSYCPNATVYVARVWERGSQTWLDNVQRVAMNDFANLYSWVRLGVDEKIVLEAGDDGVTWTSDGTHPTNPAGYLREWCDTSIGWISYIL